uniref:Keratinocyte-associated protein 3 isoform X4 n=1 Tax=Castor canadensis TaxID=51338 RepID=A0A8B7TU65_CASCN|nr:keratinocyte-associated protein 3 isoform X4 [Castor canadensis]
MRDCRLCSFDAARGPRRLMRVGLALILVGHVNLLVGAVLHGTVLRHVANPRGAVTPEYTTANVISVGSGLLVSTSGGLSGMGAPKGRGQKAWCLPQSVSVGLVALLASRNLLHPLLDTALALWIPSLLMSAAEAALSGYCCVAALTLRGVGPCRKEGFQEQLEELTELEPPICKRQENVKLLDQHQEFQASEKTWV